MRERARIWWRGALAASISGLANSFLKALGIGAARLVGIKIDQLNLKQVVVTTVGGGAIRLAMYLRKSPLPDYDPPQVFRADQKLPISILPNEPMNYERRWKG